MEGTESVTPLENLFNGPSEPSEPAPIAEHNEPAPESTPQEPEPKGEQQPAPPAEEHENPEVKAFKAKAIDEAKKRQKLEQDFAELQRKNAQYEQYLRQLQAQQQRQQAPQQPQKPQALRPDQFDTYEAYLEAVAEQKASAKAQEIFETNMRKVYQAQQQQQAERQQQVTRQQTAADLAEMVKAGVDKYPDFEQVIANPNVAITDAMMNALMANPDGHEVGYFLGQNPGEAARIARMPPSSQAREIGKLAKQLAAPLPVPTAIEPPPAAQVTAPPVPELPKTLTQTRSAGGQFTKTWTGPTPLDDVVKRRK